MSHDFVLSQYQQGRHLSFARSVAPRLVRLARRGLALLGICPDVARCPTSSNPTLASQVTFSDCQDSSPLLVQNGTVGRSQASGWKAFRQVS